MINGCKNDDTSDSKMQGKCNGKSEYNGCDGHYNFKGHRQGCSASGRG